MLKRGVISFPKCGRTWIRLFLYYYWMFAGIEWSEMEVVFSHERPIKFKRHILLIRHPCDVMVSYFLHAKLRRSHEDSKMALERFIRNKNYGLPHFNEFYVERSGWTKGQKVVRYEDLFDVQTWIDMLEFLDIPIYKEAFDKAIEKTRFDNIRSNLEEISTFPSAWRYLAMEHGQSGLINPSNPEAHKFRRGKVGGYVDYLGEEDIRYILDNFTLGENLELHRQQYLLESKKYHA